MDKHHLSIVSILGVVAIVGIVGIIIAFSGANTGKAITPVTKDLKTAEPIDPLQELGPAKKAVYENEVIAYYDDGSVNIYADTSSGEKDLYYWCADVNNDEAVNVLDILYLINYKFKNGAAPFQGSGDVNNDGKIDIIDINYLINYKYKNGPAPVCGEQPTPFFDLQVTDIIFPTIYNGQKVDFKIVVKNKGNIGGFILGWGESYCLDDPSVPCGGSGGGMAFPENPSTDNPNYIGPGETKSINPSQSFRFSGAGDWIAEVSKHGKGYYDGVIYDDSNPENDELTKYFSVSKARFYGYAYIGEELANSEHGFSQIIDSDDLLYLGKWMINFGGESLITKEYIDIYSESLMPVSSLSEHDYDYGTDVPLEAGKDSLKYCYSFLNGVDLSQASNNNPLQIFFLGQTMNILSIIGDTGIKLQTGKQVYLDAGFSTIYTSHNGTNYTVTLDRCSNDAAVVIVDGVAKTINQGDSYEFGYLTVKVITVFNDDGIDMDAAILFLGTTNTFFDRDAFLGENQDDPDWVWSLADLTTQNPRICAVNDFDKTSGSSNPATPGESYTFPNDWLVLNYESVSPASVDYLGLAIEFDPSADLSSVTPGLGSVPVFTIKTDEDNLLISNKHINITNLTISIHTDTIYLYKNSQNLYYYYKDPETGTIRLAGSTSNIDGKIVTPVQKLHIWGLGNETNNSKVYIIVNSVAENDDITIELGIDSTSFMFKGLGQTQGMAEYGDLWWDTTSIMTQNSLRTKYGTVILDPRSNADNDKVKLSMPFERFESEFSLREYTPGSSSSSSGGGSSSSSSSSSGGS